MIYEQNLKKWKIESNGLSENMPLPYDNYSLTNNK